jgi:signal peptidase II
MTEAAGGTPPPAERRAMLVRILAVALLTLVLDLGTKMLVTRTMPLNTIIEVIPGLLNLHHIKNTGAAFGIGTGWPAWLRLPFFVVVFVVAGWILYSFYLRCTAGQIKLQLSLGLVAGGAVGNTVDRVLYRRVTDFIDLHIGDYHWPFFNVADMAITVGVALLFIEVWRMESREQAA